MIENKKDQIINLLNTDESIQNEIQQVETVEEFLKVFSKHGFELSVEEADELFPESSDSSSSEDGSLTEAELEAVSGGSHIGTSLSILWWWLRHPLPLPKPPLPPWKFGKGRCF